MSTAFPNFNTPDLYPAEQYPRRLHVDTRWVRYTLGRPSPCCVVDCDEMGFRVYEDSMWMECPPARYPPGTQRPGRRTVTGGCREHLMDMVGIDIGEVCG